MLTASPVTLLNKFDNKPIEERHINYNYYIQECIKIIDELETKATYLILVVYTLYNQYKYQIQYENR